MTTSVARAAARAASTTAGSTSTTTASSAASCPVSTTAYIPSLDKDRLSLIETNVPGAKLRPLEPIGAAVYGIDLTHERPSDPTIEALEAEMANRGFLVFKDQPNVTSDQLVEATQWWGGRQMHSTHGVHPATPPGPNMRHIFRLANDRSHGILGVGPQWHNDGSFEAAPFSHVAYHIIRVAEQGGGTHFCHQGAAYDRLTPPQQEFWSRLTSVNSNSGVLHPLVHMHPISQRMSIWLHMGMTGAVIEKLKDEEGFRLLNPAEMKELFITYNALLDQGLESDSSSSSSSSSYAIPYEYEEGDVLFIDNYAVGHRASPEAHQPASVQGLRIMHRTTGKAPFTAFSPQFGLPLYVDINGPSPFGDDEEGVWIGGGIGFQFDEKLHFQN
jgi:taurine dioxygenase